MRDLGQSRERTAREVPAACQVCEALLPDAVDGVLTEAEQRAFDRHVAGCSVCARELEEAQRGAAWLSILKQGDAPEPPALLLEQILLQTTGGHMSAPVLRVADAAQKRAAAAVWNVAGDGAGEMAFAPLLPGNPAARPAAAQVRSHWKRLTGAFSLRPMLQPHMAMTAAMAFFSVALTLNLTGVQLRNLHAAEFRPASLRRFVTDRSAAAVRSFQNIRVVYQAEAQVHDLRSSWQAAENSKASAPDSMPGGPRPAEKPSPNIPHGSSRLDVTPADPRLAMQTNEGA